MEGGQVQEGLGDSSYIAPFIFQAEKGLQLPQFYFRISVTPVVPTLGLVNLVERANPVWEGGCRMYS